jgi:hypothetical protein
MSEIAINEAGGHAAREQHHKLIALVIIFISIRVAIGLARMHL